MYNYYYHLCCIESYPLGCTTSIPKFGEGGKDEGVEGGEGEETIVVVAAATAVGPCIRGDNAWIAQYVFFFFPMVPCLKISTISMVLIYRTVRQQEKRVARYIFGRGSSRILSFTTTSTGNVTSTPPISSSSSSPPTTTSTQIQDQQQVPAVGTTRKNRNKKSRLVATQGLLYISVYMVLYLPPIFDAIVESFGGKDIVINAFDLIVYGFLLPFQGFLNCLVFMRNNSHMKTMEGQMFQRILTFLFKYCCYFCCYLCCFNRKSTVDLDAQSRHQLPVGSSDDNDSNDISSGNESASTETRAQLPPNNASTGPSPTMDEENNNNYKDTSCCDKESCSSRDSSEDINA